MADDDQIRALVQAIRHLTRRTIAEGQKLLNSIVYNKHIPKKRSHRNFNDLRPISILSNLCSILETAMGV